MSKNIVYPSGENCPSIAFFQFLIGIISDNKKYRLGRILTIIDACISDSEQRKGIKDLIENAYWERWETDEIKEVFRQFFQRFAQELIPKDKDDLLFWNDKGIERSSGRNYFPEN